MDEPLSALDKQLREQLQYEIKRLHHELGLTVVYVTHDQTEAHGHVATAVAVFTRAASSRSTHPPHLVRAAGQRLRGPVHRREQPDAQGPCGGLTASVAAWSRGWQQPWWPSLAGGTERGRPPRCCSVRPEQFT
jgi:hypothetical protein